MRQYMRKRREKQAENPLSAFKIYICVRFPNMRAGNRAFFQDGFLITAHNEIKGQVERHPGFGRYIFPLALDLSCRPPADEDE
jgi:hypothetical protein